MSSMKPCAILLGVAVLCGGVAPGISAGTVLTTLPDWDGFNYAQSWGVDGSSTYGQTFYAPSDNVLTSFTFQIAGDGPTSLQYQAFVYAWDGPLRGYGGQAVGSALFQSGPSTFTADGTSSFPDYQFQAVTVNTGLTSLVAGQAYVIFLTISDPADYDQSSGNTVWGLNFSAHGANGGGGGFVFANNMNDPSLLTSSPWDTFSDIGDLAFEATFTAVPEPATAALAGVGLACVVAAATRRRGRRA